ncbi:DUF4270 family protein [Dyadobacter sp. NIV53]|uniref:DUF4270 family protein n=1 Tax=Dyadobacter sp. NIV53 TaxID=2861765 RepID=UPI001C877EF9|nr:DUF4270 family protein [Dyadobacter sp. NIV53]
MASCQWGDEIVSLVQPNPDDFTALFTDTTTVKLSIVAPDSVMTGSSSRIFVGRFADPYMGKMHAASFFQPTLDAAVSLAETAVYDSLILALRYDGYYYGDTTKLMNLSVHALTEDILDKNVYFNNYSTPYDAIPLGKISLLPRPRTPHRVVKIKLSNVLGKKVFDLAKGNLLTTNSDWINLLKGITVLPGASDNGAVVGFTYYQNDSTGIQLHYHNQGIDAITKDSVTFNVTALYNQVVGDRSQTVLAKLPGRRYSLPTSQTGEKAFIQAGPGIMTRVDLPSIRQLKDIKYTYANRAYLRITPLNQSAAEQFKAPSTLYAYYCDKNNEYYSGSTGLPLAVTDLANGAVSAPLVNDMLNNTQYYLLDLSAYVSTILSSDSEEAAGLLLRSAPFTGSVTYPDANSEFTKGFHRLVFGSQNNPTDRGVKLELYYTVAKGNQ